MLDKFLEIAHREQTKTASRDAYVELMAKLPVEELLEIRRSGQVKLAFGEPACGPGGGASTWLDHFKDTPLYPQAIALEEEELKLETARQQSSQVEQVSRDEMYREQDALRIQKRLLEIELAKMQMAEESAGQPPPPPTPGMGPPGMGAQGAGAVGDMAPEGAQDGAVGKFAAIRMKVAMLKTAKEIPSAGRGDAFGETVGDVATGGARAGGVMGGLAGAAHGALRGHGVLDRAGKALSEGAAGAGLGALAGGAMGGGQALPGAAVGSMTGSPLLGALGGGGLGAMGHHALAGHGLPLPLEMAAAGLIPIGALSGMLAGARAKETLGKRDKAIETQHSKPKKKEASVADFIRASAPAVGNFVKSHPGAAIGGALGALHGATREDGGIGSAVLEGAGGAALGHGAEHMYRNGGADKLKGMMSKMAPEPETPTVTKEAFIGPLIAGAGKALAGAGGIGGLATKAMGFLKANPAKAVGAGLSAGANMMQAHQAGQGMGATLLSGAAGGASALG